MSDFQSENWAWINECFGREFANSQTERALRFLEEALELAQTRGLTRDQALTLVDYVYSRDIGHTSQEIGGVLVCLAALCSSCGIDMMEMAKRELDRCKSNTDKIRVKHLQKGPGIRTPSSGEPLEQV